MRRRDCLGSLGWVAGATLPVVLSQRQAHAEPSACEQVLSYRYDEFQLVSRRLTAANFDNLQLWDERRRSWENQPAGYRVVRGRIVILHFWADYCAPCRVEFPWLKLLAHELIARYRGQVQMIFISDTSSPAAMVQFIEQNQATLPWDNGPHYLDTEGHLRHLLGDGLPGGALVLPTTLVCDPFIVRHGLIGPLVNRRTDLRGAIERLLQTLPATP